MAEGVHRSVLLCEALHFLDLTPGRIIVDATIGGGGHAEEIMRKICPGGMLIGIDRDRESLKIAHERLRTIGCPFKLVNKNFKDLEEIMLDLGIREVDGILFDLGISSIQMDSPERGFSIKNTGPLDMRMDRTQGLTAKDLVNSLTEYELSDLVRDFGEERFHRRIAKGIVDARKKKEIDSTSELAEIVMKSIPYKAKRFRNRIHPATRVFQALRIKVNNELSALEEALRKTQFVLKKNGRLSVISFHSLEDRIVKNVFKELSLSGVFRILTKKPVRANEKEVSENPRSRSAKLRAAEKVL